MTSIDPGTAMAQVAHRKEWVEALRSGRYLQGTGCLRNEGLGPRYCCLGVACEIGGVDKWLGGQGQVLGYGSERLVLPLEGMEWLGVNDPNPSIDWPNELWNTPDGLASLPGTVAEMNDSGWTFNQIADVIEYFGFTYTQDATRNPGAADGLAHRRNMERTRSTVLG